MELYKFSATKLAELLHAREISSVELTRYFLDRIEKNDKFVGSYITVCAEEAIKQAKNADKRIARGDITEITGLPISVKDNICTEGIKTTCASKMLESFVSPYNATAVDNLISSGAVILGKVNMDEFAIGATGELSALLSTKNPLNPKYVPGGSSSGSAASVAAGLCVASVGSDTGGSVRVPASFCGLVGFKPSYGAISRYGLIAHASSLDQIGILAKNVTDIALLASVMYGVDTRDISTLKVDAPKISEISLPDITFAFSNEFLETADFDICDTTLGVCERLRDAGAKFEDVSFSMYSRMTDIYRVIASAELSSNIARFDGIKYGYSNQCVDNVTVDSRSPSFGREVKKRILIGNYVLSEENFSEIYEKACCARDKLRCELEKLFERADVLLTPVSDSIVLRRGECMYDGCESYRSDIHTVAANLAGCPAVSIPAGRDKNGMPISVQLMSKRFSDSRLLSVAAALEKLLKGGRDDVL